MLSTLSFILLSSVSAQSLVAPASAEQSLVAPVKRRRVAINPSDHFDEAAGEHFTCYDEPVTHTWNEYYQYSGALKFTAPTLDKGMKLIFKSTNSKYHLRDAYCDDGEKLKGCTVKTSKNKVDTIFSPADWVGQKYGYDYYVNFGFGSWGEGDGVWTEEGMDFQNELQVYYCYPKIKIYFDAENDLGGTVANVAAFLAQAAWESGDFMFCEETLHVSEKTSSWKKTNPGRANDVGEGPQVDGDDWYWITNLNAGCTQREDDGARYADINSDYRTCAAITDQGTYSPDTGLTCEKGNHHNEGCCWWGRGAMQATGPGNIGAFYNDMVKRGDNYNPTDVDLCKTPSKICDAAYPDLRWETAFYFWATTVQSEECFESSLAAYTAAYDATAESTVGTTTCQAFSKGVGGTVNAGGWEKHAHGEKGRAKRFADIVENLKTKIESYESGAAATDPLPADQVCTGVESVDWILWKTDMVNVAKVEEHTKADGTKETTKYTWSSFCSSWKKMI